RRWSSSRSAATPAEPLSGRPTPWRLLLFAAADLVDDALFGGPQVADRGIRIRDVVANADGGGVVLAVAVEPFEDLDDRQHGTDLGRVVVAIRFVERLHLFRGAVTEHRSVKWHPPIVLSIDSVPA